MERISKNEKRQELKECFNMKKIIALVVSFAILLVSVFTNLAFAESEGNSDMSKIQSIVKEDRFADMESVLIGSGGYITGLVIHPLDSSIMYIRTDVGGAYRWEEETESWTQLLMFFELEGQYSVDGICVDPANKDVVYICVGGNDLESSGVWRSSDRGNTWEEISPDYDIIFKGNSVNRGDGECIAVDPNNSDVLWVGTRGTGLFYSTDGGKTWEKSVLNDGHEEVRCIIFDGSEVLNGKSKTVYAVSLYDGLYRSTDAGATFKKVEGLPKATCYHEAHLDSEGRVLITFGESRTTNTPAPPVRGLWRLNKNGSWENFGANLPMDGFTTYMSLEVDDNDPDRVLVGVGTGMVTGSGETQWCPPIYYTTDGGKNWTDVTPALSSPYTQKMASSWKTGSHSMGCVASLVFGDGDELWMTDWSEVYYTASVSAPTDEGRAWRTYIKNIEELVTFSALSIPGGNNDNLFMAADIKSAFPINDDEVNVYPSYPNTKGLFQQADYCAKDPNFVVGAYTSQSSSIYTAKGYVYISTDGGDNWDTASGWDSETYHPGDAAVSADDPDKIVVLTLENKIFYTSDRGKTWTQFLSPDFNSMPEHIWHGSSPLESDKNKGNIFYLMSPYGFYRSEDYGATWKLTSSDPKMLYRSNGIRVLTYEGAPGEVWVSSSEGVWFSSDYGTTFSELEGLSKGNVSLGKGREDGRYVLYFCGIIGENKRAIYSSEDRGQSFIRLTDYNEYTLIKTGKMHASKNLYGRLYVGTSGLGWKYMDLQEEVYDPDSDALYAKNEGKKPFPWALVGGISAAVLLAAGATLFIFRKKIFKK